MHSLIYHGLGIATDTNAQSQKGPPAVAYAVRVQRKCHWALPIGRFHHVSTMASRASLPTSPRQRGCGYSLGMLVKFLAHKKYHLAFNPSPAVDSLGGSTSMPSMMPRLTAAATADV